MMVDHKHMNEEDFFDEGYSPPAKVYRKGLNSNFYEGEDLTEKEKPMDRRENTKEYYEELYRRKNEGGCPTCGNGSTKIEVHAVEHIFDSPKAKDSEDELITNQS